MSDQPATTVPVLMCMGFAKCGPVRHRFVRTERGQGCARLIFVCGKCAAERVWGVNNVEGGGRLVQ